MNSLLVLAQSGGVGNATTNLIANILSIAALLLLVYVLLDLARNFMRDVPQPIVQAHEVLGRVWEPVLRPLRNALPQMGGLDFSPLIVLLLLQFIATAIR
ncbi:MAG: YggT family protein [Solirubrobacteraceae bacterium]|nr:YggT family protein [Solirubrobacteraceae bacterium]